MSNYITTPPPLFGLANRSYLRRQNAKEPKADYGIMLGLYGDPAHPLTPIPDAQGNLERWRELPPLDPWQYAPMEPSPDELRPGEPVHLGIMTNAPRFPWQLANLRQYVAMTNEKPGPFQQSGLTFPATGHGSGMFGLPGDLTPPSRFVRLGVLTRFVDMQPDAERTLNLAQHIINTFDIPLGLITDTLPDKKTVLKETTQWVTFRDLTRHILYFRTYVNQNLRKIDLNRIDFSGTQVQRIPMFGTPEVIVDVTDQRR